MVHHPKNGRMRNAQIIHRGRTPTAPSLPTIGGLVVNIACRMAFYAVAIVAFGLSTRLLGRHRRDPVDAKAA
ncbi:hypothetical protein V473_05960 [Sphingobium cupriresistens LL01]|uniref:Uncharacterized protein n=1 Tax=Sphingobium cupriresistens LL01 TaxID=1420583 RepID=A0A0J7Y4F9_9SPHN|nr:hypothetical protein V473_05960 [Sphingobium cupriresistens LL01]